LSALKVAQPRHFKSDMSEAQQCAAVMLGDVSARIFYYAALSRRQQRLTPTPSVCLMRGDAHASRRYA